MFFFLMIRRPPRSTQSRSSAASDVYKRQDNDWYMLSGQVQNTGKTPFADVRVVATLYDSNNKVIGCDQTFVLYESENPFSVGTFSLYFMDQLYNQVSTYRLQVVGQ